MKQEIDEPIQVQEFDDTINHTQSKLQLFVQLNVRLWSVVLPAILSQLVLLVVETASMMFVG